MHISSSYAKILGEKLFRTWEISRSGSKAEDGEKKEKREKERERKLVITMAKLSMAQSKPPGPTTSLTVPYVFIIYVLFDKH